MRINWDIEEQVKYLFRNVYLRGNLPKEKIKLYNVSADPLVIPEKCPTKQTRQKQLEVGTKEKIIVLNKKLHIAILWFATKM